ncbi:MAG: helix-turn-helix domain-containing protein [Lachnospiraceae bacterium]|nr:helix-turn-helix domain-containing protein [Lachnospiraceae bacterium]
MNPYVTGTVIKELRERKGLTQAELAERLCVSDKTISKWETAKGYPDITLLEPLAAVFDISVAELISGNLVSNVNVSANMLRSKFYICPVCGNIIHSMGEAAISCHGVLLAACQAEEVDEHHPFEVSKIEDEYYVKVHHDMTKSHHISFMAALSSDRIQMVKLYPEGNAEARFKMNGVKSFVFYCNKDGLYSVRINRNLVIDRNVV